MTFEQHPYLFWITFSSSVLAATIGIAKFLKTGPCKLIPDQGPMNGHGTLGFVLLTINIATTIVSKGVMLAAIGAGYHGEQILSNDPNEDKTVALWIYICYLPQFLYVSIIMYLQL